MIYIPTEKTADFSAKYGSEKMISKRYGVSSAVARLYLSSVPAGQRIVARIGDVPFVEEIEFAPWGELNAFHAQYQAMEQGIIDGQLAVLSGTN